MTKFIKFLSQLSSGDASDSICPKGWGIAGISGDGSYVGLIVNYYSLGKNISNRTLSINYSEYDVNIRPDGILVQNSAILIRSGSYGYSDGSRYDRNNIGTFWEKSVSFKSFAYNLRFHSSGLYPQKNDYSKLFGMSVRCEVK